MEYAEELIILKKIYFFFIAFLFILFLIPDISVVKNKSLLSHIIEPSALITLQRIPSCQHIILCVFEFSFIGFCTAFSLFIWEHVIHTEDLQVLLFRIPYTLQCSVREELYIHVYEKKEKTLFTGQISSESESSISIKPASVTILNYSLSILICNLLVIFVFNICSLLGENHWVGFILAPTFPFLLLLYCIWKLILPCNIIRKYTWTIIFYTIFAPWYNVTFRDTLVGDIFTSMSRPLQDVALTIRYILTKFFISFELLAPNELPTILSLENDWIQQKIIFPCCIICPLWWRFCQNLRQVYDSKQRWPYLGNAAKYFCTAELYLFTFYNPNVKKTVICYLMFLLTTIYQIWWDVIMDWGLFIHVSGLKFKLRDIRLFPWRSIYYGIFLLNILLRFCWGWTTNPTRLFSEICTYIIDTESVNIRYYDGPLLAIMEIVRRVIWALLRLEWETIDDRLINQYTTDFSNENSTCSDSFQIIEERDLKPMKISTSLSLHTYYRENPKHIPRDYLLLFELFIYALVFFTLGIWFILN